ncbi:hypothetical protein H4R21_005575 [Coemansia helicoidea]|uniref:Uncharacterized protein n=1 Tax=Coemansia helicoidea TaxID=1286919 RepID=A0ACC1KSG2_9FUNG|nr:hypothetical protein H4R21_005575 [Coemansia helicoidea]
MGPRRGKSSTKRKGPKRAAGGGPEQQIEQLLARTQELMDDNKHDAALETAIRAVALDERNTQALLLAAIVQLETGDIEAAINCLLRCAELAPDRGYEKYMYLAQFTVDLESVRYYQLGVDALQRDLDEAGGDAARAASLRRKMAEAYVAMTEVYLTDCCYESDAEKKCEEYLERAAQADPSCPEVFQTMASVRLSQNRPDEARECVARSMSLWMGGEQGDAPQTPSFESRLALVRLLLELDDKEQALGILELLQKEDDESVDLWYLYGWTYHLQSEEAQLGDDDRTQALVSARECFRQAIRLAGIHEYENDALIEHARELAAAIDEVAPPEAADSDGEQADGGAGNEWEDASSGDEDVEMGA